MPTSLDWNLEIMIDHSITMLNETSFMILGDLTSSGLIMTIGRGLTRWTSKYVQEPPPTFDPTSPGHIL